MILYINLAKLNYGQPKPSSFLKFPVRLPLAFFGGMAGAKTQTNFSAILVIFYQLLIFVIFDNNFSGTLFFFGGGGLKSQKKSFSTNFLAISGNFEQL